MKGDALVIATWNVNSIRKRADQVADWLENRRPDAVCFQETKVEDAHFPAGLFDECGYEVACHGQKSYNGVAIASKGGLEDVQVRLPGLDDDQARLITARVAGVRIGSVYVPNGKAPGTDKFEYKLRFLSLLKDHLASLREKEEAVVVGGDYNIAPLDSDVYDIDDWGHGTILVTDEERSAFAGLLETGFVDAHVDSGGREHAHTWWDYRAGGFQRDRGLRIDHFLACGGNCLEVKVDKATRQLPEPSDHAPVFLRFKP